MPLRLQDSLLDAMYIMGKYGVHRIPVFNDEGVLVNLITQSSIVEQIAQVASLSMLLVICELLHVLYPLLSPRRSR